MKILHIAKYGIEYKGGIEKTIKDISEELINKGHDVAILSFGTNNKFCTEEGIHIFQIKPDLVFSYAPLNFKYNKVFNQIIADFNPDIIHIHMPNVMPMFLNFKNCKAKIYIHWHSDVFFTKNDLLLSFLYNFYQIFEHRLLKKADKIIATSKPYFEHSKILKKFESKVSIVPLGIKPLPQKNISYDDFFLTVGRFTYYKGFEYLIEAMKLTDKSVKLMMAGNGQLFPKIKKMVDDNKLNNRIKLLGEVSEDTKYELLSKCRFFCLPSIEKTEAFGVSLLEAMQYKKPLLTTDIIGSGVNFVNINNETGLVAEKCNPESLANKINEMFFDIEKCKTMGQKSYERFVKNFTIDKMINDIYGL